MKYYLYSLLLFTLPFAASTQSTLKKILDNLKNSSNNANKTQPQAANNRTGGALPLSVSPEGVKVGDIAPDAVYVEADRLGRFNGGAAIIQKGSAVALMDAKGKIIVPYNTYSGFGVVYRPPKGLEGVGFDNGFFVAGATDLVLNGKGKIIVNGHVSSHSVDNGKYVPVGLSFYDINGNKYSPLKQNELANDVSEDIVLKRTPANNNQSWKYIYCKITGEHITNADFDEAYGFSDGMALVGKKNEFGEMKYGYIDRTGKLVIPYNFSIKPGDFINGIAQVYPKDASQFEYAFINKKGEVVMQVSSKDAGMILGGFGKGTYVWKGWSIVNGLYVMDSLRNIYAMPEFLKKIGVDPRWARNMIPQQAGSGSFLFLGQDLENNFGFGNGALNLDKGYIINPIFAEQLNFDPVSRLSYARMITEKGAGYTHYREGYINEYGVFVIVKKEQSQF